MKPLLFILSTLCVWCILGVDFDEILGRAAADRPRERPMTTGMDAPLSRGLLSER